MKKFRTLAALLLTALITAALAACSGASAGEKAGTEFMLGEYKLQYEYAKIENGETTVGVFLKDWAGLPVKENNGKMSLVVSMKLIDGDEELKWSTFSVDSLEQELRDFEGIRINFHFETPEDREYPTARMYLPGDESQSVDLDIKSGIVFMEGGKSTNTQTGVIIAIVAALGIAGGIFAAKKGFFRKKPGTGAGTPPATDESAATEPAPEAVTLVETVKEDGEISG